MKTTAFKKGNTVYQFEIEKGPVGKAEARKRLQDYLTLAMLSKDLAVGLQESSESVNVAFLAVPSRLAIDGVAQLREKQSAAVAMFDREFSKRRQAIVASVMRDVNKKHNASGLGTAKVQRAARARLVSVINDNVAKQRKTVVRALQARALFVYFARAVEKFRQLRGEDTDVPLYRDFSQEQALQWCVHLYDMFQPMMRSTEEFPLTSDVLYAPVLSTLVARHQFDQIDINVCRLEFLMRRYIQHEVLEQTTTALEENDCKEQNDKDQINKWSSTPLPHSAIDMIREHGSAFSSVQMCQHTAEHEACQWLRTLLKIHSTCRKRDLMLTDPKIRDNATYADGLREKFDERLCNLLDSLPEKEVLCRKMALLSIYVRAESTDWKQRIGLNLTTTCDVEMSCNVLNDVMMTYGALQATLHTSILRARRMYDTLSELSHIDVSDRLVQTFGKDVSKMALQSFVADEENAKSVSVQSVYN